MSDSNPEEIRPMYASGYRITITKSNTDANTDTPVHSELSRESREKKASGNDPEYVQNALEDRVPADFITDDNGVSEA